MDAPPIEYARTEDGVTIAYWTIGRGYPLIMHYDTYSHIELEWDVAPTRELYQRLSQDWQAPRGSPYSA